MSPRLNFRQLRDLADTLEGMERLPLKPTSAYGGLNVDVSSDGGADWVDVRDGDEGYTVEVAP